MTQTELLNTIRAHIDQQYEGNREKARYDDYYRGMNDGLDKLEQFLDTLQEPEKPKWDDSDMRCDENELLSRFAFYTYKDEPDVLYLSNLFVEESFRNIGIGTKILAAAEKVAETLGAISICLKVKWGSPANAWYRKNGYGYVAFEDGYDWLEKTLEYMKPKQEPEVDLAQEVKQYYSDNFAYISSDKPTLSILTNIARHFAEWGAKNAK